MTEQEGKYEVAPKEEKTLGLIQREPSIFLSMERFQFAKEVAKMLATSTMLPQQFQGAAGVSNCMILLNLADRMKVDAFMLAQNIYIIQNRPGIEAKLAIALIEGNGKFGPIEYRFDGTGKTDRGVDRPDKCVAYATHLKSGKVLEGPPITWEMAKAEGWTNNKGAGERAQTSKWQTLPELMFMYRAAMFFARVHDPGALLGLRTKDELEDMVIDVTPVVPSLKIEGEKKPEFGQDIYEVKEKPTTNGEGGEGPPPDKSPPPSIHPPPEAKAETLFDSLMKARSNFKGLIMGNFQKVEALTKEQYDQVKAKWEEGAKAEKYGIKKNAPWPLVEHACPLPPEDVHGEFAPVDQGEEIFEGEAPLTPDGAFMKEVDAYTRKNYPNTPGQRLHGFTGSCISP